MMNKKIKSVMKEIQNLGEKLRKGDFRTVGEEIQAAERFNALEIDLKKLHEKHTKKLEQIEKELRAIEVFARNNHLNIND